MKEVNGYLKGFNNSNKRIDYLKYGLLNDYGLDLDSSLNFYNEEAIIKTNCDKGRFDEKTSDN